MPLLATAVLPGVRLGPMRLSAYGACAAAGLVASMALAQRAARHIGLDPKQMWDAGLFAIASCFVASRLLLVLDDPVAFRHYPLLVLGLPSLTLGGMGLAAVALLGYVRWKRLSPLRMLDGFAAPGAVLAVCLELGHALDGSEPGMPTTLPWGLRDAAFGRVHPVALYGVVLAAALAVLLWRGLGRQRVRPGQVAAVGLVLGGVVAFGLDMLTQPAEAVVAGLEPGQWVAAGVMMVGATMWTMAPARPNVEPDAPVRETVAPALQKEEY